ncbi:MAG: SPFH domain-containing protein [Planctomycetes bacterium]|nr:SPFH domain-containing protein [Planctomycetota bacterium]
MLGIRFVRAAPTTYLLHYRNGRVVREGVGLSFFYFGPTSTLVSVPVSSTDLPFVFNEVTADFQSITLQGQITYRIGEPKRLAALLDFSLDARGGYRSEDPDTLRERLVAIAQVLARGVVQHLPLREALASSDRIAAEVLPALRSAEAVTRLGLEIIHFSLLSVRPTPEMGKALEAEAREALLRRSDQAICDRRNAAVQEERRIKESELNTEIAVEVKKREIRETKMAADLAIEEKKRVLRETQMSADIAIEEQRSTLVERTAANARKDADAKAYSLEVTLKPVREMDWRTLMALGGGTGDPRMMIALAFRELAENAQKIGELNVTPDLLRSLLASGPKGN